MALSIVSLNHACTAPARLELLMPGCQAGNKACPLAQLQCYTCNHSEAITCVGHDDKSTLEHDDNSWHELPLA